jgi:putative addiction module CopG family antidote
MPRRTELEGHPMSVDLSPENEQFIDSVVAQGAFPNRKEALDEAVQLLRRRERLRKDIEEGLASGSIPAEEVHARLRQHVAEIESRIK